MSSFRIIFMGTAELACASLERLATDPAFQVLAVVTQPDRPQGRELKLTPSPVKQAALRHQLPVFQPERARHPSFVDQLTSLAPDLIVVAAYGQILPPSILELPRYGCINVHTSLLPKYRGAAPIQWAMLNGESETGVTIMRMDPGLDTGEILTQRATPILLSDNGESLHARLATLGAQLLIETIAPFVAGQIVPRPQPTTGASYARKITKEDGRIDWHQPATTLWNRIRALTPWPGAFTLLPLPLQGFGASGLQDFRTSTPQLLKLWQAAVVSSPTGNPGEILVADKERLIVGCAEDSLSIQTLQREGRKRLTVAEFLTGSDLAVGQRLV